MPVVMKGGTSGNREDALAPVPSSGVAQPVLNTATNETSSTIQWCQNTANGTPGNTGLMSPDVPTGGGMPEGSPDVQEQGLPGADTNPLDIFRGAPNTGTKGGPA